MFKQTLQKLHEFLASPDNKALLESSVDISNEDNSSSSVGTGKTDKIINKGGTINLNNSTTNNLTVQLQIPPTNQPENIETFRKQLLETFKAGKLQFLRNDSAVNIEDYNHFEQSNNKTKDIIQFFTGKISTEDLQLLRTGLYIKSLTESGNYERAMNIKDASVKDRHSRNIINLVTAGYFENYIIPIFKNNDSETAGKEYSEVIRYLPEIIFVNNTMNSEDIVLAVEDKMAEKERYHLKVRKIMVNGIGKQCEQNIIEARQKLCKIYPDYQISIDTRTSNNLTHCKMQISLQDFQN